MSAGKVVSYRFLQHRHTFRAVKTVQAKYLLCELPRLIQQIRPIIFRAYSGVVKLIKSRVKPVFEAELEANTCKEIELPLCDAV